MNTAYTTWARWVMAAVSRVPCSGLLRTAPERRSEGLGDVRRRLRPPPDPAHLFATGYGGRGRNVRTRHYVSP